VGASKPVALSWSALAVVLGSGCASWEPGPVPRSYVLIAGYAPPSARRAAVADTTAAHTRRISFHLELADARRYWWTAEAVVPEGVATDRTETQSQPGDDEVRWWHGTFDGVRLPVALTGSAVDYFMDLQDDIRAGQVRTSATILSTRLDYFVHVSLSDSGLVHVDTELEWAMTCGSECALLVRKERSVVLRRDGSVLTVDGDGPGLVEVAGEMMGPAGAGGDEGLAVLTRSARRPDGYGPRRREEYRPIRR